MTQTPPQSLEDRYRAHDELLLNIKHRLPELEALIDEYAKYSSIEDLVYRFWHHSLKVYALQEHTARIVAVLEQIAPQGCSIHPWFNLIVTEGTGKKFALEHNENWLEHTRPILEAFFHAEYMLRMAVTYGRELEQAPTLLPSGWAALLTLYGIR